MAHTLHVTRQRSWLWLPTLSWVQTIRHPPVVFGAAHDTVHLVESIISTAHFQQCKYQNWIVTPSCVPLRSTKQRGHQKRVGWTRMWMCAIVGHSASLPPPSVLPKAPYIYGWLLSSLNLLCLQSPPKYTALFQASIHFSAHVKGWSGWELGSLLNSNKIFFKKLRWGSWRIAINTFFLASVLK